ncbi:phage minor head protein [Ideonella sp.]|uniref:phage head morphogenesis protein n=1 Tax=Ideonella sp. TaxID=1929293 RepID=UPI003BB7087B
MPGTVALDLERIPAEALAWFQARGIRITWDWHEMLRQEHALAFTVAKATSADVLAAIRTEVEKALGEGQSFDSFKKTLKPRLMDLGWWGRAEMLDAETGELQKVQLGSDRRLRTIFQTNVQTSYMAGRYQRQLANVGDRPYWQYIAVMDGRTRPAHAALNGRVFRWDDPIWQVIYPPNGWGCRCRVRALTPAQVEAMGLSVSNGASMVVTKDVQVGGADGPMVTVRGVKGMGPGGKDFFPDPGWDYNPGAFGARSAHIDRVAEQKTANVTERSQAGPQVRIRFNARTKAGQWHQSSFDNAPDWLRNLVVQEQTVKVQARSNGAWARGGDLVDTDHLVLDSDYGRSVWRHEFGHVLDHRLADGRNSYISSSDAFAAPLRKDASAVLSKAREHRALYSQVDEEFQSLDPAAVLDRLRALAADCKIEFEAFEGLVRESLVVAPGGLAADMGMDSASRVARLMHAVNVGDAEGFVRMATYLDSDSSPAIRTLRKASWRKDGSLTMLADLVGSSTKNLACSPDDGFAGHSDAYYARAELFQWTESFANMTSLAGHPVPYWWSIVKRFFPEGASAYERIVTR